MQKNQDLEKKMNYIEIWGTLNDGGSFLIRTPMESIQDSVTISNRFYAYIGMGVIMLAAVIIWFYKTYYKTAHRTDRDLSEDGGA